MDGIAQPLDFATLAGALGIENLRIGTVASETLARGSASGAALYLGNGGADTDVVRLPQSPCPLAIAA